MIIIVIFLTLLFFPLFGSCYSDQMKLMQLSYSKNIFIRPDEINVNVLPKIYSKNNRSLESYLERSRDQHRIITIEVSNLDSRFYVLFSKFHILSPVVKLQLQFTIYKKNTNYNNCSLNKTKRIITYSISNRFTINIKHPISIECLTSCCEVGFDST